MTAPELFDHIVGALKKIDLIAREVAEVKHLIRPTKEWYTKQEAAALKGVSYKTLDKAANRHLWPNFGQAHVFGAGRKGWHWSEIEPWLSKDDETLEREYRQAIRGAAV